MENFAQTVKSDSISIDRMHFTVTQKIEHIDNDEKEMRSAELENKLHDLFKNND